ncbi:MAG: GTP-binding protein [Patescibacteria group bacterium]|jgi:sulfate adenylyltransferase large subunit
MLEKQYLKLVITGHVDHGKSTLIGRLLYDTGAVPEDKVAEVKQVCESLGREMEFGFITDHFQEEREQGITIDTTQIFFKTEKREYVIIDAPGHKEFLKNMITGASQAEAAILIVDASEGVQEQTKRHAYVLSMLGIQQVIVAVNKMDLVEYKLDRFNEVVQELKTFLSSINLKPTYIIPVSANKGENIAKRSTSMKWYNEKTILEALDSFTPLKDKANETLRFPIQDVYKVGDKRVLVGRLESGSIKQGDKIIMLPSNNESEVTSIEEFGNPNKKEAHAGESIGITIKDDPFIERGEIICKKEEAPQVSDTIKANVFWMSKQGYKKGQKIVFRSVTQEVPGTISIINKRVNSSTLETLEENAPVINNTEVGEVTIKLEKPIVIDAFSKVQETGRFVLADQYDTVAGGIIPDIK